jgi:hypothetical protein
MLDTLERYTLSELQTAGQLLQQMLGTDDWGANFKELV